MSDFLRNMSKTLKDDSLSLMEDGISSAEFGGYIDTGSYALNLILGGSIYRGWADNKVLCFAGESSVGKTFYTLGIVKAFLDADPENIVVIYDTESASTKEMMKQRGIDTRRVLIGEPETIQEFRTKCLQLLDNYIKEKKRPKMLILLDSLGALSTTKELADSTEGKDTRDMTRSQAVRGTFRTIRLKLSKAMVPFLMTNHTYTTMSLFPTQEVSGGGGVKYSSDAIAALRKKQFVEGSGTTKIRKGNIVVVKMHKSRLTKENSEIETLLTYDKGLDRYYGLLPLAMRAGIFEKKAKGYLYTPTGATVYEKDIISNPEKYYTKEVLDKVDEVGQKLYNYGMTDDDEVPLMVLDEEETVE